MRRYKRSAAYRKGRSEFMKRWWYEKKHGIPHRQSKPVVPVRPVSVKLPPHYDAEFWELLDEKCSKYEERHDEGKLYVLRGIRHFATWDARGGRIPAWLKNWLRYFDVDLRCEREDATRTECPSLAAEEYDGFEDEEDLWWDGEEVRATDDEGEVTSAYGVLPSERFYGRGQNSV